LSPANARKSHYLLAALQLVISRLGKFERRALRVGKEVSVSISVVPVVSRIGPTITDRVTGCSEFTRRPD
jgi:hypothetical protein